MIRTKNPRLHEVIVYAGRDPVTSKERRISRTVHGGIRQARARERELIAEAKKQRPSVRLSVAQLLEHWMSVSKFEASTRYQNENVIRTKIDPYIGDVTLVRLKPFMLEELYARLQREGGVGGRPLAPGTVRKVHGVLKAALNSAVDWEWIERNPAQRARGPSVSLPPPPVPDTETVRHLLAVAEETDPFLFTFVRILAATGMRRGEVCALRWTHVDFPGRSIRRLGAIGQANGYPYEKITKTGAVGRIGLDERTCGVLGAHRETQEATAEALDSTLNPDAFVFSYEPDGSAPVSPGSITQQFRKLRKAAGVNVQLRHLRHFHATMLIEDGMPIREVSDRLGHARMSTTLNFYMGGPNEEADRRAAEYIDRRLDGG